MSNDLNKKLEEINNMFEKTSRDFEYANSTLIELIEFIEDFIDGLPTNECTECGEDLTDADEYHINKRRGKFCMSCYYETDAKQKQYDKLLILNDELIDENSELKIQINILEKTLASRRAL